MSLTDYHREKPVETYKRVGVRLSHSAITTVYLIRDIVDTLTLDDENGTARAWQGNLFEYARPSQGRLTLSLGRVGSEVTSRLKQIRGFDLMEPVEVTLFEWLSDSDTPQYTVTMFSEDISMTIQGVSIVATQVNAASYRIGERITIGEFPGLEYT